MDKHALQIVVFITMEQLHKLKVGYVSIAYLIAKYVVMEIHVHNAQLLLIYFKMLVLHHAKINFMVLLL